MSKQYSWTYPKEDIDDEIDIIDDEMNKEYEENIIRLFSGGKSSEIDYKEWERYLKPVKMCNHTDSVNIFGLVPISYTQMTNHLINKLIREKNIKAWCILDLSSLTKLDIDKLIDIKYYVEPIDDYSVPSFKEMNNIIEFISENTKDGNVIVSCMAGHGRTGMVLSIWAGINGIENPIDYIRKNYCDRAVETVTQEMFVNLYLKYLKQ